MGNPEALDDDHVLQMIELLGPLPDNLKRTWSSYRQCFGEHDVQTSLDKHPNMSQGEAEAAMELLERILRYDPAERPSPTDLLTNPWIVEFCRAESDWAKSEQRAATALPTPC